MNLKQKVIKKLNQSKTHKKTNKILNREVNALIEVLQENRLPEVWEEEPFYHNYVFKEA